MTKLDKKADSVTATIDDGKGGTQTLTVERVISAVGVVGNIENLGLEKLGVKTERGTIVIDGFCKTNVPGIYAIGDVAGPADAGAQGRARGRDLRRGDQGPEAASDGQAADPGLHLLLRRRSPRSASPSRPPRSKKLDVRVGRFPFVGNGKAIALGEDQGLVKVIFDKKTGQLLGAHMVGAEVTELIQGYRGRDESRDHRGRADAHDLPASDPVGDDEGSGARRLRARAEHVGGQSWHDLTAPSMSAAFRGRVH